MQHIPSQEQVPVWLAVDLDGTLINSDLFVESCLRYFAGGPWRIFRMLYWWLQGRAFLKRQLAQRVPMDAAHLPYWPPLVECLRDAKSAGRKLILVSGSDDRYVQAVAQEVALFDLAKGSDGQRNLVGTAKADFLVAHCGEKQFDYIGNARVDLKVWRHAAGAYVVAAGLTLAKAASEICALRQHWTRPRFSLPLLLRCLRVHQWSKNLLLFLPLLSAHKAGEVTLFGDVLRAAAAFSLAASCVYIANDTLDVNSDRLHEKKRHRPLASGKVSISQLLLLASLAFLGCILLSCTLPWKFGFTLAVYAIATFAYSGWIKRLLIADIVLLAGFYLLRVLAGGFAAHIVVSQWLQLFCLFFFTSLAALKRFCELQLLSASAPGRGYIHEDARVVEQYGIGAGLLSVLVLALYTNSKEVQAIYSSPQFIWLVCPLLLYWIGRVWILASRGAVHHDPIVFALKDVPSYLLVAVAVALMAFAASVSL